MSHYDGRFASSAGTVKAVDVAAADAAGFHADANFIGAGFRIRHVFDCQLLIPFENQRFHGPGSLDA